MDLLDFNMRYLVTTEIETPFLLKVRRFFRLAKPRAEFFVEHWSYWYPGETSYYLYRDTVKIIKHAKQRLVWKQ